MEHLLTGIHLIAALLGDGRLPELARAISKRGSYNGSDACSPSYNAAIATIKQVSEANVGPVAQTKKPLLKTMVALERFDPRSSDCKTDALEDYDLTRRWLPAPQLKVPGL
ncbi:MAG: hypothetical protein AAAB35_00980 [Phyllobacterium sp.]|uniref:hypothetical protein n=1 Tax=Phyllobacterium sp. TaxID=1871046 RepID=UPI0030F2A342